MKKLLCALSIVFALSACSTGSSNTATKIEYGSGTAVRDATGWTYYINNTATNVHPYQFDNGPDYFTEGLARFESDGKMGFFDTKGTVVIPATYDFASAFCSGIANVCIGCTQVHDGDHTSMNGGLWGHIDRKGKIVTPVKSSKDSLREVRKEAC